MVHLLGTDPVEYLWEQSGRYTVNLNLLKAQSVCLW